MPASARLDSVFFALSDPTRRELLALLEKGPATVSDLASRFRQSLPGISKHLRVLSDAGLLRLQASATDRRAKTCALESSGLAEVEQWVIDSKAAWSRRFDAMEKILEREAKQGRR
jgi:DNA-binding transcriptional ArsR family regulator